MSDECAMTSADPASARDSGARRRWYAGLAVLALVGATALGCGTEDGGATASDTSSSAAPALTESNGASDSSAPSGETEPSGDQDADGDAPASSPVIDEAVEGAIDDDFPALVPASLPDGWSAVDASYTKGDGGLWRVEFTAGGASVFLVQAGRDLEGLVAEQMPGAQRSGSVNLGANGTGKWGVFTAGNSTAIAKSLAGTSAVIVAPDQDTAVALADQLLTAEDSGAVDGG